MPRKPDERIEQARKMYLSGMKLVAIASQLNIPEGTVRRWKSTHKWDGERSDKKSERSKKKTEIKKEAAVKEVEQVLENADLTDKQRLFCIHYIRCFNATKAYQKAYNCSYETACAAGPRMLGNVRIKSEIQKLKQNRLNREFFSEEDLFQKYMDIAFADITDYVKFGQETVPVMGAFGPVQVENKETGRKETLTKVINTVKFRESTEIDGTLIAEIKQGKDGATIKLLDKMKAMQWLSEHMDMATEEQKARIAILKAKVETDDSEEVADDGFLDALNASAGEDWADEED